MIHIQTIIVTEDCRRLTNYNPSSAIHWIKENNGTVFFHCKELKIEEKITYVGGNISEIRVKYNRKVVDNNVDIPNWDEFFDATGLW